MFTLALAVTNAHDTQTVTNAHDTQTVTNAHDSATLTVTNAHGRYKWIDGGDGTGQHVFNVATDITETVEYGNDDVHIRTAMEAQYSAWEATLQHDEDNGGHHMPKTLPLAWILQRSWGIAPNQPRHPPHQHTRQLWRPPSTLRRPPQRILLHRRTRRSRNQLLRRHSHPTPPRRSTLQLQVQVQRRV
jgi:hypothetical protein